MPAESELVNSKPTIVDNRDGTISLKYEPRSEGAYEMQIKCNNEHIKGSPYKFVVDNTSKGLVTAFGRFVDIFLIFFK